MELHKRYQPRTVRFQRINRLQTFRNEPRKPLRHTIPSRVNSVSKWKALISTLFQAFDESRWQWIRTRMNGSPLWTVRGHLAVADRPTIAGLSGGGIREMSSSRQTSSAVENWPRRRLALVLGGLMLAIMLSALDQTIVSTALPTIASDLGSVQNYSWIVTAYLVTTTASRRCTANPDIDGRPLSLPSR